MDFYNRRSGDVCPASKFDGGNLFVGDTKAYGVGKYLGGGSAGVVYQATNLRFGREASLAANIPKEVALKILNPLPYKLLPSSMIRTCLVVKKGERYFPPSQHR